MDVDQVSSNTESVDNCYEEWVAFNRSSGMRSSAYEHLIPERLFSTEENPAEGVSTAKALALAMAQGQRVYTLTQDNSHNLSQITIDSEARTEIQNAIQRGYEVTVHETPLNVNGWQGSGYAIIDPENGVGAYKISGGASGGSLFFDFIGHLATIIEAIAFLGVLGDLAIKIGKYLGAGAGILGFIFGLSSFIERCIDAPALAAGVFVYSAVQIGLAALGVLLSVTLIGLFAIVLISIAVNYVVNLAISANPNCKE